MIKEALLGILSSGSSLGNAACHLGGYLDDKATDLNKAKLCLAILESMTVKRASTLDALEDEIAYIQAIVG